MTVAEFPKQQQHWLKRCLTSDNGKTPLSVLANVMTALEVDTEIRDAYAFDEMLQAVILIHPIGEPQGTFEPRPVTDEDATDTPLCRI